MATPWTQRPTFPLRPPSHPPPSLRLHARPRSFTVRPRTHREVRRALLINLYRYVLNRKFYRALAEEEAAKRVSIESNGMLVV